MASLAYNQWLAQGEPYTLMRPAKDLQRTLQGHGLVVFDYPDEAHLQDVPPEDHTPFSATGWPKVSARWIAHAIDIMPRRSIAGWIANAENTAIARRLIEDKDAGVLGAAWIKYINWTDEDGKTWHTSWQPDKRTVSSSDTGHVHVSGRSDMDNFAGAADYDPLEVDDVSAEDVWEYRFQGVHPDTGLRYDYSAQEITVGANYAAYGAWDQAKANAVAIAAAQKTLNEIKALLTEGGGSGEAAVVIGAISTKIDEAVADLTEVVEAQVEDAVADLGEGGATKVRAEGE